MHGFGETRKSSDTMDDEDFETWKICWRVNLTYYTPFVGFQKCILCSEVESSVEAIRGDTQRSTFWSEATRCSIGHAQKGSNEAGETPKPGICSSCDQNYIFDIMKGKHYCRVEGCSRTVRVNPQAIQWRLQKYAHQDPEDKELFQEFLDATSRSLVYECLIHCDEVSFLSAGATNFKPPSKDCKHDRNVCDDCLKITFETAIQKGRLQDLKCPDSECQSKMSKDVIRPHVSPKIFKIYNKKLANEALARSDNFRWCTCGHGQVHAPGETNPEWKCLNCKKRHCFICKEDSSTSSGLCSHLQAIDLTLHKIHTQHKQSAIKLFQNSSLKVLAAEKAAFEAREDEAGTKRLIAMTTKKCPKKGCGLRIERNEGCGHFTCKKCRTQFCWSCKVIWSGGSPLHLTDCRLGTRRTVEKRLLDKSGYEKGWDKDVGYEFTLDKDLWLIDGHR